MLVSAGLLMLGAPWVPIEWVIGSCVRAFNSVTTLSVRPDQRQHRTYYADRVGASPPYRPLAASLYLRDHRHVQPHRMSMLHLTTMWGPQVPVANTAFNDLEGHS